MAKGRTAQVPAAAQAAGGAATKRYVVKGLAIEAPALAPGLYVVATPIGNLRDMTLRALETLAAADIIACEDTRVTRKLLDHYGIATPLTPYHDHNATQARPKLLARLAAGAALALVSDAGTPLVSDPVFFEGFLPAKAGQRRDRIAELARIPATLLLFETGPRIASALADLAAGLGRREAALCRELTKLHEEVRRGDLATLAGEIEAADAPRGEIVIVIAPPEEQAGLVDSAELDALLRQALGRLSVKEAVAEIAVITGRPRREVYQRALALAKGGD